VGDEQPRTDESGSSSAESPAPDSPDVIDLRGNGQSAPRNAALSNGSAGAAADDETAEPASGRLTANEWWDWVSLGQQISDLQRDTRRITGRVVVSQRSHVSGVTTPSPLAVAATESESPVAEPEVAKVAEVDAEPEVAEPEGEAEPEVAEPELEAEPEVTEPEVAQVDAGPEVAESEVAEPEPEVAESEVAKIEAVPGVAEVEAKADVEQPEIIEPAPEVQAQIPPPSGEADAAQEPEAVPIEVSHPFWSRGKLILAIAGLVVFLSALAVAIAIRNDSPSPRSTGRPTPSGAASPVAPSKAVTWLAQNTAAGTRLLVPPELVKDFAAGLPGREVLANDDNVARNGDLLVVTADSGDDLEGTLTLQVLKSSPVVARLPGSDLQVHQVSGPEASDLPARVSAGTELLQNLGLTFVNGSSSALRSGQVDERVLVVLAGLASQHSLTVALVPDPADAPDALLRTFQIQGVDGHPVTAARARDIKDFVTAQRGALAGPIVDVTATSLISVRYPLPSSFELLNSGSFPTISQESP
jgi:hypothetical protein